MKPDRFDKMARERLTDFVKDSIPVEEWDDHNFYRMPGTRDDVTVPLAYDIQTLLACHADLLLEKAKTPSSQPTQIDERKVEEVVGRFKEAARFSTLGGGDTSVSIKDIQTILAALEAKEKELEEMKYQYQP